MLWSVGYGPRPVFSRATTSAHTPSASEAGSTRADSASSPARSYANAPPMVAARSLAPGGSSITRYGWSPALAQAHPPRVLRRNGAQRTRRRHTSPTSPDTHTKICGNPRPPRRRRNQVSGCRVQGGSAEPIACDRPKVRPGRGRREPDNWRGRRCHAVQGRAARTAMCRDMSVSSRPRRSRDFWSTPMAGLRARRCQAPLDMRHRGFT
jgi:hypothetical protein